MNGLNQNVFVKRKILLLSLCLGFLAALGAAGILAIIYALSAMYISGHNLTLLGWNGIQTAGFDWPYAIFTCGILFVGVTTTLLNYRAWTRRDNKHNE